jgi:SAM-dependent methyltransferase
MRLLSSEEIETLHREKVLVNDDPEYLGRYDDFDFAARFGSDALHRLDFPRMIVILEFERIVGKLGISPREVLMLNGGPEGDPELALLPGGGEVTRIDYETDPRNGDLHTLGLGGRQFDFVLFSQTIEHLYNPPLALDNVFAVTRPGGWVWTSLPTVSRLHQVPLHFWTGATPGGLACLFAAAGFEVAEVGQWGNGKYAQHLFDLELIPTYQDLARGSLRARGYRHIGRAAWRLSPRNFFSSGRRNEFQTPVQTWIMARRPAG